MNRISKGLIIVIAVSTLFAFCADVFAARTIVAVSDLNHKNGKLGTYRALIIGIQNYNDPTIPDLETPLNDARAMAEILKSKYGFKVETLLDNKATKEAMYNTLRNISANAKPEDSVLIYYAGHGERDRQYDDGWWIPVDAKGGNPITYLDNTQVQKAMRSMKARHVLLISDSCYSGTLFGQKRAMPQVINDKYYLSLYNEKSRWGMTSGNKTPVSDSGTAGHSVFAYQLIKKLKNNDSPYLSTQELYTYIAPIIGNNSEQTPLCRPIKNTGDQGGEFIFVAKGTTTVTTPTITTGNQGKLSIMSEPLGADIFIDNKFRGRSPLEIDRVDPGIYRVGAIFKGFDNIDKNVKVNPNRKAVVTFYFEKKETRGSLYVSTKPQGCEIKIKNTGQHYSEGMKLEPGQYKLQISKSGYATKSETIQMASGEDIDLYVELEKKKNGSAYTEPVTGMEFVWVKGGCYQMGQTELEKQYLIKEAGQEIYNKYYKRELPRHKVCVDGFWMAKCEVTRGEFRQFINQTSYRTDADKKDKAWIFNKDTDWKWKEKSGYNWEKTGYSQSDKHPVACVSWNDAKEFIKWLNKKTGQKFSLPTEAQWEYAARAGTETMRFWGSNDSEACKYANVADKGNWSPSFPCSDGYKFTAPVRTYRANSYGLYDMLGNVWEWCEDVYDKNAYSKHRMNNPLITSGSSSRVYRGGSWDLIPRFVRAANRGGDSADSRSSGLGFRLCLSQVRQ